MARLSQTSEGTGVAAARHIRPLLKKGLAGVIGCFNLRNTQWAVRSGLRLTGSNLVGRGKRGRSKRPMMAATFLALCSEGVCSAPAGSRRETGLMESLPADTLGHRCSHCQPPGRQLSPQAEPRQGGRSGLIFRKNFPTPEQKTWGQASSGGGPGHGQRASAD